VLTGAGLDVSEVFLVHLNNRYVRQGALDIGSLFTVEDVTEESRNRQSGIPQQLGDMRRALEGGEPAIDIGPHCTDPYECDFRRYCWQHIPDYSIFDIANLRTNRKFSLYYRGVLQLKDIPPDFSLSDSMKIQVEAELTDRKFINKGKILEFLATVLEPIGFLDFETFMEPVPSFDLQRPYQQMPFQYSLHILDKGKLLHHEFLGNPGSDPRPDFIGQLLAETGECRTIVVYNQAFEISRLRELARDFPVYSAEIESLITRTVDLMTPFKNRDYYVPEMRGSHSIKYVLPALVPDLSYEGLAVADGEMAMLAYDRLARSENETEKGKIRRDLLAYCRMDTLGMVRIWERLGEIVRPKGQLRLF